MRVQEGVVGLVVLAVGVGGLVEVADVDVVGGAVETS